MAGSPEQDALDRAAAHARRWRESIGTRPVPAQATADEVAATLGGPLPASGAAPAEVVDRLVAAAEPGLMSIESGRFYGWVMGGSLPAALAADWLVSAWDQNAGMRAATPGVVAVEDAAGTWLLSLLGLPAEAVVGFPTGATAANLTCLAAGRHFVLRKAGADPSAPLSAGPPIRVLAGEERHSSVDLALRYLGLGLPETVRVDPQGRLDPADLERRLHGSTGPVLVCLQAGNIHSGAFDPFRAAIDIAHRAGAWVHVDGAFGLWAAVVPELAPLVDGLAEADSWATDAHKTLNTPYDGGIAIVRSGEDLQAAMGVHADYLLTGTGIDPFERVPEMSRRARGVPIWAALASLGVDGVRELVGGLVRSARSLADGLGELPGATVLNDVVYTQVSVAFESDGETRRVLARLLADGAVLASGSLWHGRAVIRFSVSNHRTDGAEVARTLDAVRAAIAA